MPYLAFATTEQWYLLGQNFPPFIARIDNVPINQFLSLGLISELSELFMGYITHRNYKKH